MTTQLRLETHVSDKGEVTIAVPEQYRDLDVSLLVEVSAKRRTWPDDFFTKVAGSIPDFPDVESEGDFEQRKSFG